MPEVPSIAAPIRIPIESSGYCTFKVAQLNFDVGKRYPLQRESMMQLPLSDQTAASVFVVTVLASLGQFVLLVLAVLALRRAATAQEATARALQALVARSAAGSDAGAAR